MDKVSNPVGQHGLMRAREILELFPISRTGWWNMVKAGQTPAAIRIGKRTIAFKRSEIYDFLEKFVSEGKLTKDSCTNYK